MSTNSRIAILKDRIVQIKSKLQTKIATIIQKHSPAFQEAVHGVYERIIYFVHTELLAFHALNTRIDQYRLATARVSNRHFGPYMGLVIIATFVLIGNEANQRALAAPVFFDSPIADLAPETVQGVLSSLDSITPELNEEPELVASILLTNEGGYLSRPQLAQMAEAETQSKKDPIPYTVQQGDTMVAIAQSNSRSVATILDANNIKPEDAGSIKPGVVLLIPQEDTSYSLAWLEADQKVKAEAAARLLAARRDAQLAASKRRTSSSNRALAATTREQSSQGFAGSASLNSFVVPVNHNGISRGVGRGHMGIDYRASTGTSVVAAADGRVIEITHGWAGGFGNSILVDHGGGLTTRYAHLSVTQVSVGQTVGQGERIGLSGNTGRSTGPHLHFETHLGGRVVSPF